MDNILLYNKLLSLPENMKAEVSDFIEFLLTKVKTTTGGSKQPSKPKFGSGKGIFKIKPGFDDPIEDFNDYMH